MSLLVVLATSKWHTLLFAVTEYVNKWMKPVNSTWAMSFINYYSCTRIVWLRWCEASYINSIAYQSDLLALADGSVVKVHPVLMHAFSYMRYSIGRPVPSCTSGGSRNWDRGVQPLAHETHPKNFWLPHPLPVTLTHSWHVILIVATDW